MYLWGILLLLPLFCYFLRDQIRTLCNNVYHNLTPASDKVVAMVGRGLLSAAAFARTLLESLHALLMLRALIGGLLILGGIILVIADWELLRIGLELLVPPETQGYTLIIGSLSLYIDPSRILATAMVVSQLICGVFAVHPNDLSEGPFVVERTLMQKLSPWLILIGLAVIEGALAFVRVQQSGLMNFLTDPAVGGATSGALASLPPVVVGLVSFFIPLLTAIAFAHGLKLLLFPIVKLVVGGIGLIIWGAALLVVWLVGAQSIRAIKILQGLLEILIAIGNLLVGGTKSSVIGTGQAFRAMGRGIAKGATWTCRTIGNTVSRVYHWVCGSRPPELIKLNPVEYRVRPPIPIAKASPIEVVLNHEEEDERSRRHEKLGHFDADEFVAHRLRMR